MQPEANITRIRLRIFVETPGKRGPSFPAGNESYLGTEPWELLGACERGGRPERSQTLGTARSLDPALPEAGPALGPVSERN
jgi:hypothetical protein